MSQCSLDAVSEPAGTLAMLAKSLHLKAFPRWQSRFETASSFFFVIFVASWLSFPAGDIGIGSYLSFGP